MLSVRTLDIKRFISEPNVTISLGKEIKYDGDDRYKFVTVTCRVDNSYERPRMCISYRGILEETIERLNPKIEIASIRNWFQATHQELLRLPKTGSVLCHVYDSLGKYSVSTAIGTQQQGT